MCFKQIQRGQEHRGRIEVTCYQGDKAAKVSRHPKDREQSGSFCMKVNKSRRNKEKSINTRKGMNHFHKSILQRNEIQSFCLSTHQPLSTDYVNLRNIVKILASGKHHREG